ncbi:Osmotin thaumatin-like protein [Fomitopsis schrenkii]|uniref:Osmotin thaumatin-like protein n=1 Tax=Fomitopsis schrenkii TaxID=2126942 RepID=S8FTU6_FOMSC|nr:Osmotin thaumatin-like protein [Fomitopsis schrenkii]
MDLVTDRQGVITLFSVPLEGRNRGCHQLAIRPPTLSLRLSCVDIPMMKSSLALSTFAFAAVAAADRTFVVYNGCPFTVWPAIFTGSGTAPSYATGWEADAYTDVTFSVPDDWTAGRIWGRRDCDFSDSNPATQCADGGCIGGLECSPNGGTGIPPATLAEFTLSGSGGLDYYDVSLVDGYNLPMSITNNVGCSVADCPVDLGPDCPAPLIGPYDSSGYPVGCKSACEANLDGDPTNSPNCCTGQYDTAATCPSSGVAYYSYFKDNCPNAYCYAYDESSGTAIHTCATSDNAEYTVTFCPSASQDTTNGAYVLGPVANITL